MKSKVFLIPNIIAEQETKHINVTYYEQALQQIEILFVENLKPARHFLKLINKTISIDAFEWVAMDNQKDESKMAFIKAIKENKNIGIISDAGCPCVADPGNDLVFIAQQNDAEVIPLIGASSILLALMSSGFSGQRFVFHGYLPIQEKEKSIRLKELENNAKNFSYTQIFIETPFRNQSLLEFILKNCNANTLLCIASNLSSKHQFIKTASVHQWRKQNITLQKIPCIFLLFA